uniref:Endonuclease/exonuclease/phosphatase domain-containing protein n=1 Tax=Cacopsylla melanoneura TaxID=428564 RepID=A0A8D8LNY5_9HEMI
MADRNTSTALSTGHPLSGDRVRRISPLSVNEILLDMEGAQASRPSAGPASHSDSITQSFQHRNTNLNSNQTISLLKPSLVITSVNIEGLSSDKEVLLSELCTTEKCDILVLQETHKGSNQNRPKINGMNLILERSHEKYGSAIFSKPDLLIISTDLTSENNIEILTVELSKCTVTSVYKPPGESYSFKEPCNFRKKTTKIVIGDFNCHHVAWGYNKGGFSLVNFLRSEGAHV